MTTVSVEKRYMEIARFFGRISGLWPILGDVRQITMRVLVYTVMITSGIAQISKMTVHFALDELTGEIPYCIVVVTTLTKYSNYILYSKKLETLIVGVKRDWEVKRTEEESQILLTFTNRGILLAKLYAGNIFLCFVMYTSLPIVPRVLDIMLPANETRPRLLLYPAYYFVNYNKYYWMILAHQVIGAFTVSLLFIVCDASWVFFVQHACGLFEITGYRLKHAIDEGISSATSKSLLEDQVYRNVANCIRLHKRAIEYRDQIEDMYIWPMLIHILPQFMCTSMTLVQIMKMELDVEKISWIVFVVVQLIHMLFHSIQGQFVESHAENVYRLCYEACWYNASPRTQALFVLVLRRCLAPTMLTAGGMVPLNFETYTAFLKASMSYYTVFRGERS